MSRKPETIAFWRGRLPHWEVVDGRYFVTIHLAGAIPPEGQERIQRLAIKYDRQPSQQEEWLRTQRRIYAEMEAWLDRTDYVTHLQDPRVARMVMDSIVFRERDTWTMLEYVVMPSHIHLFFELKRAGLKETLEQFKRWTGHQAAKFLSLDGERFWQDEWFDHWSRSDEQDERIIQYIRRNPERGGLVASYQEWPYGSWSK